MLMLTTLLLLTLVMSAVPAVADDPEARALVQKARDSVPTDPMTAEATLESAGGWTRELEISHKRLGDEAATLLVVTAPTDVAGTKYLLFEKPEGRDRQFVYLPQLTSRIVEVMDEARREPFLGSDFYVSDLMAPDINSFTYSFVGEEEVGGRPCRLLEAKITPDGVGAYPRSVFAVDPDALLIMRVQSFDDEDKLFKVWTLEKLEVIDGKQTPTVQKMRNVQTDTESTLTLRKVRYGADLPDSMFSKQRLSR